MAVIIPIDIQTLILISLSMLVVLLKTAEIVWMKKEFWESPVIHCPWTQKHISTYLKEKKKKKKQLVFWLGIKKIYCYLYIKKCA